MPVPLVQDGMAPDSARDYPAANFDIADDGTLVYLSGTAGGRSTGAFVWVDRSGNEESLGFGPDIIVYPRLSPDGSLLLVSNSEPPRDIGTVRLDGTHSPELLFETPASEVSPKLSPDGRWIFYDSDESGRAEVYMRPFPNVDDSRIQVSVDGGRDPLFSRDGKELFYWMDPGTIVSVPVAAAE